MGFQLQTQTYTVLIQFLHKIQLQILKSQDELIPLVAAQ